MERQSPEIQHPFLGNPRRAGHPHWWEPLTISIFFTYTLLAFPLAGTRQPPKLTVIKQVINADSYGDAVTDASEYKIEVVGISPAPAQFPGSEEGTVVALVAGA